VLRAAANGERAVTVPGNTVAEIVDGLVDRFPAMKPNLIADDGTLHRFVNVYVNDEDVRYLDRLDTAVSEGDEISILPAVAGG
jgi:molybdopterin converting factor small subunit